MVKLVLYYVNHHLVATLKELTAFENARTTSGARLGRNHFRHWTTRSHGWCTPTARLTAMTVLLVGETYKRGGAPPRLPMDCWYRILNMIPRYELRMGQCTAEEEDAAQKECFAIVLSGLDGIPARSATKRAILLQVECLDLRIQLREENAT